jgi:hypothetical protein
MEKCMTESGSGAPTEFETMLDGVRVPMQRDDRDASCERQHTQWISWVMRAELLLPIYGDAVAIVMIDPSATTYQIDAVRTALVATFPESTVRFIDQASAFREMTSFIPESAREGQTEGDMSPQFRLSGTVDATTLDRLATLEGITSVMMVDRILQPPEPLLGATNSPSPSTTAIAGTLGTFTLDGREYKSYMIDPGPTAAPVESLSLRFVDGVLTTSANSGCKAPVGRYKVVGGVLELDMFGHGDIACATERGKAQSAESADAWLSQFFGSRPTIVQDGFDLRLTSGKITIRFSQVLGSPTAPVRPLIGTRWLIDTITSNNVATNLPGIFLTLPHVGMAQIDVVCGSPIAAMGTYMLTGNTVTIDDPMPLDCGDRFLELDRILKSGPLTIEQQGPFIFLRSGANSLRLAATT